MPLPPAMREERGAVLIVMAVLILALLSVLGLTATRTAITESRIAVNLHLHRMAFYQAEGGARVGMELIEDAIHRNGREDGETVQGIVIDDGDFHLNADLPAGVRPSRENAAAHYPADDGRAACTRLMIGGAPSLATGGGIQALNGYGGAGRTAARGGAWIVYDIRSRHTGRRHNEATVELFYRHVL